MQYLISVNVSTSSVLHAQGVLLLRGLPNTHTLFRADWMVRILNRHVELHEALWVLEQQVGDLFLNCISFSHARRSTPITHCGVLYFRTASSVKVHHKTCMAQ